MIQRKRKNSNSIQELCFGDMKREPGHYAKCIG